MNCTMYPTYIILYVLIMSHAKTPFLGRLDNPSFCVQSSHIVDKAQGAMADHSCAYNLPTKKQAAHRKNDKTRIGFYPSSVINGGF